MLKQTAALCVALSGLALSAQTPAKKAPSLRETMSKYGLTFYGHLRLDSAYDMARTNNGNVASFVQSYNGSSKSDEFNMTAQHTRFGLARLEQWLGDERWDVIHFNWGLHDLCWRHPESKVQGYRDKVRGKLTTTGQREPSKARSRAVACSIEMATGFSR